MAENWSREEVEAIIADYFSMLEMELIGQSFNKAEHNRHLQKILSNRTKGSIERKHQNISALMIELGFPYIDGYKPLGNYQELLREVLLDQLAHASNLCRAVACVVEEEVEALPSIPDLLKMQIAPPERDKEKTRLYDPSKRKIVVSKRNYLEIEARNQSLGRAGEELILRFEHERLWRAGERRLADKIEHVSQTQGDGLGYDILSFETDGRERLIEVKTTRFGPMTPFFASRNEVEFSESKMAEYYLYRLHNFRKQPEFFALKGSLRNSCSLTPALYAAALR